jgi:hypothetical protein
MEGVAGPIEARQSRRSLLERASSSNLKRRPKYLNSLKKTWRNADGQGGGGPPGGITR